MPSPSAPSGRTWSRGRTVQLARKRHHGSYRAVYVADSANHRIQKFDTDGTFLAAWGSFGSGNGQFIFTRDVATNLQGDVYVLDRNNHRVQKFTSDGVFLMTWGSLGSAKGQFNEPHGVDVER